MEIREVGEKITKSFGKNGKYIVMGLGAVIILYFLTNKSSNEDSGTWVTPTGYTSYPDAVTNANVIMEEVNKHTTAEISNLQDSMDLQFGITSDFMGEGIDNIIANANANKDQIVNQIVSSEGTITGKIEESEKDIINKVQQSQTAIQNDINSVKNSGTSQKNNASATSYYAKTSYKGVSLVDGLKAIGIYKLNGLDIGNWHSRVNLAKANGISNYSGTASQNTTLLNLLKQGKLKKA